MPYGLVMDVPAPIEVYDALHAEVARRSDGTGRGMLLHVGRATGSGFQIIEVWESKELYDRFAAEVLQPAMAAMSGGQPPPQEPAVEEFDPRGLIIPSAATSV